MYQQTFYEKYLDLAWYEAISELFDEPGLYMFDSVLKEPGITLQSVFDSLNHPGELMPERKRALALCFSGTDLETPALTDVMLAGSRSDNFDAFLAVAAVHSNSISDKKSIFQNLSTNIYCTLEEAVIALTAFTYNDTKRESILRFVGECLKQNMNFILNNPQTFLWLLEMNHQSSIQLDILNAFYRAVFSVPDSDSCTYGTLFGYRYQNIDVAAVVWELRKLDRFSRATMKNDKAVCDLRRELAQHFTEWNDYEKYLVKRVFKGNLKERVCAASNYKWYYNEFGFHLPEMLLNMNDSVGLKQKLPILSDYERCRIAAHLLLDNDGIKSLQLRFSDWDTNLQSYFETLKDVTAESQKYYLTDKNLLDLPTELQFAKVQQMDEFSEEEIAVAVQIARENSLNEFVRIVACTEYWDQLSNDDINLYRAIQYRVRTIPDGNSDFDLNLLPFVGYPHVLQAVQNGFEVYTKETFFLTFAEEILELTTENASDVLPIIEKLWRQYKDILRYFAERSCVVKCAEEYIKKLNSLDTDTAWVMRVSQTHNGKWFRKWTGVSVSQCISHRDITSELFKHVTTLKEQAFNPRYSLFMSKVCRAWILHDSPMRTLAQMCPLSVHGSYNLEWFNEWLDIAKKSFFNCYDLSEMGVCYGYVQDVEAIFTNVGIVVKEPINYHGNIPVWCSVPENTNGNAVQDVFLAGPISLECIETFLPIGEICCDVWTSCCLQRCN